MEYYTQEIVMAGFGDGPDSPGSYARTILDYLETSCPEEATKLAEEAIARFPQSMMLHFVLARSYVQSRRVDDARRQIDYFQSRYGKAKTLTSQLATLLMGERRLQDAIHYFREAHPDDLDSEFMTLRFGQALRRTGQLIEAEEQFEKLLATCEEHRSELLTEMSAIRFQQERFIEAEAYARDAMQSAPVRVYAIYRLGLATFHSGDTEAATCAFQAYANLKPNRFAPYRWLERMAREAGDDEQADAYNMKAREILEQRRVLRMEKKRRATT